jgi:hypothetical protein
VSFSLPNTHLTLNALVKDEQAVDIGLTFGAYLTLYEKASIVLILKTA